MKLKTRPKRLLCGDLIMWIWNSGYFLWWFNLADSSEICKKKHKTFFPEKKNTKKIHLAFVVGTSCCHDNHWTQTVKVTEIHIYNYDIQENLETKLQSEKCYT